MASVAAFVRSREVELPSIPVHRHVALAALHYAVVDGMAGGQGELGFHPRMAAQAQIDLFLIEESGVSVGMDTVAVTTAYIV